MGRARFSRNRLVRDLALDRGFEHPSERRKKGNGQFHKVPASMKGPVREIQWWRVIERHLLGAFRYYHRLGTCLRVRSKFDVYGTATTDSRAGTSSVVNPRVCECLYAPFNMILPGVAAIMLNRTLRLY